VLARVGDDPVGERPADPLSLVLVADDGVVEDVGRLSGAVVGVPRDTAVMEHRLEPAAVRVVADGDLGRHAHDPGTRTRTGVRA